MKKSKEYYISKIEETYLGINKSDIKKNNKKIAIIKSGPASMSVAISLVKKGYNITIFHEDEEIGGILRYGSLNVNIPIKILELSKEKLINLGVKIKREKNINIDKLKTQYDAVFLGDIVEENIKDRHEEIDRKISKDPRGMILTSKYGHTSIEGIFAYSDVLKDMDGIINSITNANVVAESIDNYCNLY